MTAGFVDLDVRYVDPITGQGVALDSIKGLVKNALGATIEEIVPDPYLDVDGAYYSKKDYDIRNAENFSGLFLTVDWIVVKGGVLLPTFPKRYDYAPVADAPANKTIVYWDPPETEREIGFYEIYRERQVNNVTETEFLGRSFGPSFVDNTVYADEFQARSWAYRAYAFYRTPGTLQDDGSDYINSEIPITPRQTSRTGLGICLVEGRISDVTGAPYRWQTNRTESWVSFFMDWNDRHSYIGDKGLYITPAAAQIPLASDGGFSAALVHDVVTTLIIEWSGLRGRFVVPRTSHAYINELDMVISKTW